LSSDAPLQSASNPAAPSLTERLALHLLRRQRSIAAVAPPDDPIHLLTPEEQSALQRIERQAVWRAAAAGALSALASAVASIVAHISHPVDGLNVSWHNLVTYWGWVGTVTLVASIIEIGFLYWDALRSVHNMACAAGLALDAAHERGGTTDVLSALARAALELPNPPKPLAGIDPHREASPLLIIFASLLYKAKIALSTLLLKALIRGALGRATARAVLDLIGVPVTAVWNAVVCHYVLREARLRILGPSAVVELLSNVLESRHITRMAWQVAERAVASAVVRTRDFHPNHVALIGALSRHAPLSEIEQPDNTERFILELAKLGPTDQEFVLRVLVIAAILDGRLTRAERRLLAQAFSTCQRRLDLGRIRDVLRAFRAGRPLDTAIRSATQ